MPVPNSMADLATLASSNFPTGTEAIGNSLDNYIRAGFAITRSTNAIASATIASASTTDIASADGEHVQVTGTATINSLGSGFAGCRREVLYLGAATIVNSASIVLPGAANIVTQSGEIHLYRCLSPGVWRLVASSNPEIPSVKGLVTALAGKLPNTGNNTYTGLLTLAQNGALGGTTGSEQAGVALFQNNGSGSSTEEFRTSMYRPQNGGGYETAVFRLKRFVSGFSQSYHDYYSGQILSSRAHGWGYAGSDLMWLDTAGNLVTNGNMTANSDESLKENWRALPASLVEGLAGVLHGVYDRKDIEQTQVGVGAQSLRKVLPWAVRDNGTDTGKLAVDYGNAALVSVIAVCQRLLKLEAAVYGTPK